jgi:hypothetical protein
MSTLRITALRCGLLFLQDNLTQFNCKGMQKQASGSLRRLFASSSFEPTRFTAGGSACFAPLKRILRFTVARAACFAPLKRILRFTAASAACFAPLKRIFRFTAAHAACFAPVLLACMTIAIHYFSYLCCKP